MPVAGIASRRQRRALAALDERHVAFLDVLRRWEGARTGGLLPAETDPFDATDERHRELRRARRDDLVAVVFTGTPAWHHVAAQHDGRIWRYDRLILPVARDGRRVDRLVVCVDRVSSSFMH